MGTMKEQSQKIRSAGVNEPGKENERTAKGKPGAEDTQQPKEEAEVKPNGLEGSEPPLADRQGAPTEEITEPPEPTKKDESDMNKPPEAFMDPEDAQRIGGDPEKSEQFAGERDAEAQEGAGPGVDEDMVNEMGPDKGLTDHLTEAFQNFLEPGKKKQKTSQEHSEEIRRAGNEEEPSQKDERGGSGAREPK